MGFGLQQVLCGGIWVCSICPATHALYILIGVNFPCLSIILVEKKHGHTDLVLQIFCSDFPQLEMEMKCGNPGWWMCHEKTCFTAEADPTLTKSPEKHWAWLAMGGRGANVVSSGLHLSTNYKQTTIISILSKCRKSKTVFPYFAKFGNLQRPGNCIPLPTNTGCFLLMEEKKIEKRNFPMHEKEKEGILGLLGFYLVGCVGVCLFVLTKRKKCNWGNMAAFSNIEDPALSSCL